MLLKQHFLLECYFAVLLCLLVMLGLGLLLLLLLAGPLLLSEI